MTVLVQTSKGLVDRDQLQVVDEIVETSDARVVHTVWKTAGTGEEVRRDVSVSILRGLGFDNVKGA
jgi:hypothetical protein